MSEELKFYQQRVFELTTKVNQLNADNAAGQIELNKLKKHEKLYRFAYLLYFFQFFLYFVAPNWFLR